MTTEAHGAEGAGARPAEGDATGPAPRAAPAPSSDRLVYRRPTLDDLPAVLEYRSHPEFLRYYEDGSFGELAARAFLQQFLDWEHERPPRRFGFAVEKKGGGPVIGICSLRLERPDAVVGEIGFELSVVEWGRGYATEMGAALLRAGFEQLDLHRVQAHCIAENEASRRVLERLGLTLEGRLREKHRFKGRYWDELWFGILRPDWEPSAGTAGR